MQSPEYPDLRWVPPKAWTNANRTAVQLIVIHTTEGSAHDTSAEDGAAYNQRRDDGTSAHYFVDSDSVIHCVRTADQAHTARRQGNRRGIHYELCGRAGWSATTWAGPYAQAMLRLAAKQAARDARKWDIPVRHLTVSQVAAGEKGFCGHWDITRAFPQDNGTHTDPGKSFPWSQFLDLVRAELKGDAVALTAEDKKWLSADNDRAARAAVDDLLGVKIGDQAQPFRTVGDVLRDAAKLRGVLIGDAKDTANAKLSPTSPLAQLLALAADIDTIRALLEQAAKN